MQKLSNFGKLSKLFLQPLLGSGWAEAEGGGGGGGPGVDMSMFRIGNYYKDLNN